MTKVYILFPEPEIMLIFGKNQGIHMFEIEKFTFNPFAENTYVLFDDTKECIIIDPGCYDPGEEKQLTDFIDSKGLKPVKLVLTHSHIDHVLGNSFVTGKYNISIYAHKLAPQGIQMMGTVAQLYGIPSTPSPDVEVLMEEGDILEFGNTKLEMLHCPGHSPDSLVYFHKEKNVAIGGDVLFYGSIGRTDLPGGDHDTLIRSIKEKLFNLPDDMQVYSGHGPETTIGQEKKTNPFLN